MKTRCILSRAIALALTLTCTGGGYTSFATEVKSDDFFKKATAQKVIDVKDNTTVTPSPSDPIVVESYGVGKYKINVADGKNLELRNLYMNNPVIQGRAILLLA